MTAIFRKLIADHVAKLLDQDATNVVKEIRITQRKQEHFGFSLSMRNLLSKNVENKGSNTYDHCCRTAQCLANQMKLDHHYIDNVFADNVFVIFKANFRTLVKEVLRDAVNREDFKELSCEHRKNIIVEYSSPNIAKPFHVGHLRSTIIGNFVANVHEFLGHNVTRINYLGDWGVQFGLLGVGFEKYGSEESLIKDTTKHLFNLYVRINTEAKEDKNIYLQARMFTKQMEEDDKSYLSLWKRFRDLSLEEYKSIYKRLDMSFNEYSGESLYNKKVHGIVNEMKMKGLVNQNRENGASFIDVDNDQIILTKNDNTTTYIARDIAAAIDRYERYKFDAMYYATASQQNLHFQQLFKILRLNECHWVENCRHIGFGMVKGMSTRKGNVVFLQDILDEAKERMLNVLTRDHDDTSKVADQVGIAAILIQDMKAKRIKDYEFNWEKMLASHGDTGPRLQYEHARLVSIENKTGVRINADADVESLLSERSAINLIQHIARFESELVRAKENLEPSFLVNYLFTLSHLTSVANHNLKVIGQAHQIAEARMLLLGSARKVLAKGLKVLGIVPLNKM